MKPELNNFTCGGYQRRTTDCTLHYIKENIEMPMLTAELFRVFIRRIEVFEKPEKYSQTCGNTIVIHYTFECDKAFTAADLGKSA